LSYIDAHLHLADPAYIGKVDHLIEDSTQHNVSRMLSNATDHESSLETINLAKRFPDQVLAAIGVHPFTAIQSDKLCLDQFRDLIARNEAHIRAIGEIGLDGTYTQDDDLKARQKEVFQFFLTLAEEKNLPVMVHSRQAVQDVLETLAAFPELKVLMHWYDGPQETLPILKERGFLISVGPAVLYSRKIGEITRATEASMILAETDGPVKYRDLFGGEPTKPSHVVEVVRRIAELKAVSLEDLRSTIQANFEELVGRH
jgi:TatD DNase family protein